MKNTYKNRYGDQYTFTRDENHDILWEGDFKYYRFGMPNDYTRAYEAYCNDTENKMSLEDFKKAVHVYDNVRKEHSLGRKYVEMVDSLKNEIDMVDPSGGPYLSRGMSLDSLGFEKYKIEDFQKIDTGYKIITEKCPLCHQAGGIHKMSCSTQKIQINL